MDTFRTFGHEYFDVNQTIGEPAIDISSDHIPANQLRTKNDIQNSLHSLRQNIVGNLENLNGPYGVKPLVYADWTASARSLVNIENYIQQEVLPLYGNTHTTTSLTGHQSTCFRQEARQIVAESTNAKITGKAAIDTVLFTGNGTTSAIHKLIESLGMNLPFPSDAEENMRPIVFTSSYEHHSNILPWRESVADVVTISYDPVTGVSLSDLENKLIEYKNRKISIGAFSAASNVTGILTDVDSVSILLHLHGALAVFDYATAAPYVKIDMNPTALPNKYAQHAYKDAIYFSGHKFLGGPGCPGVLVIKRKLLPQANEIPTTPGGGTVFYVTSKNHRYLSNREEREEAGTSNLIADIKIGLVMHVKRSIGANWIQNEELRLSEYVTNELAKLQNVVLLGKHLEVEHIHDSSRKKPFLPIFSFLIRCNNKFLHYSFVCALLNDLFGIQSRGGCMCAGPFSQLLLGITSTMNERIETALLNKQEVLRPGYTRLSFQYWMSEEEINYIIKAIRFVSLEGWKFLPNYRYNHKTGEWAHLTRMTKFPERKWLSNFRLDVSNDSNLLPSQSAKNQISIHEQWGVESTSDLYDKIFENVNKELLQLNQFYLKINNMNSNSNSNNNIIDNSNTVSLEEDSELHHFDDLKWFITSNEVKQPHFVPIATLPIIGPIQPISYEKISEILSYSANDVITNNNNKAIPLATSAFITLRNQKLKSHDGHADIIPRYIQIFNEHKTFVDMLTSAQFLSDKVSSNLSNITADVEMKNNNLDDNHNTNALFQKSKSYLKESPANQVSKSHDNIMLINNNNNQTQDLEECIPRNGKILSGPGVTYSSSAMKATKFIVPPKKIMKSVGQAIKDWNMIEDGDRLLVGLSGGKDSLALLHILLAVQKRAPVKFEIACATVDPQTESFDPSPLIPYVQSLGVTYHYLSEPIVELAKSKMQGDSLCAFCARFKRGLLYSCCRNNNYNKLVLAQHLDDLAESFMMSALHNGQIRTMKANYKIEAGDVRVIRPLIYVREKATRDFSQSSHLPIINENCPACFESPKERARVKQLLAQEEAMVPALFHNLKRAFVPLLHDDTYVAMSNVIATVENNNSIHHNTKNNNNSHNNSNNNSNNSEADIIDDGKELISSPITNNDYPKSKRVKIMNENADNNDNYENALLTSNDEITCSVDDKYCPACYELA
eukprot:gene5776-7974_t